MKKKKKQKEKGVEVVSPGPLAVDSEHSATRPLALPSMFWTPDYLASGTPAWVGHIPFAFWVMEAHRPEVFVELGCHYGNSYFAFCQAVERLQLDARCYAVDTWKGDEHSGFYGEEVWAQVNSHNSSHYAGFSTLVRSSFDEARTHFEDGTIDLLHIDGHHTFDAVRHDFETWLPKLSSRGLVLLHDTNVRFGDFGVSKFFSLLKQAHPTFEFHHGHGLGVIGVGPDHNAYLRQLFSAASMPTTTASLHRIFSRLGQSCMDLDVARGAQEHIAILVDQLTAKTENNQNLEHEISNLRSELQQAQSALANAPHEVATSNALAAQLETERNELAHRLEQLTDERDALAARISALEKEHSILVTRHSSLATEREALHSDHSDLSTRCQQLTDERDALAARISALEKEHSILVTRHSSLATEREALHSDHSDLSTRCQQLTDENKSIAETRDELGQSLDERFQELAILAKRLVGLEDEVSSLATREETSARERGRLVEKITRWHMSQENAARQRGSMSHKLTSSHNSTCARVKQTARRIILLIVGAGTTSRNKKTSVKKGE